MSGRAKELTVVVGDVPSSDDVLDVLETIPLLRRFLATAQSLAKKKQGEFVKSIDGGYGFVTIFQRPEDAFTFATKLHQQVGDDVVRIGIHTGAVTETETVYGKDVYGQSVILAGKLASQCPPRSIVLSDSTRSRLPASITKKLVPLVASGAYPEVGQDLWSIKVATG